MSVIWSEYDADGSGHLDKEETRQFIMDTIREMGDGEEFTEDDFDECFAKVDLDGSGTIDFEEMLYFIKVVASSESQKQIGDSTVTNTQPSQSPR